jgi:hypothetical protein
MKTPEQRVRTRAYRAALARGEVVDVGHGEARFRYLINGNFNSAPTREQAEAHIARFTARHGKRREDR